MPPGKLYHHVGFIEIIIKVNHQISNVVCVIIFSYYFCPTAKIEFID